MTSGKSLQGEGVPEEPPTGSKPSALLGIKRHKLGIGGRETEGDWQKAMRPEVRRGTCPAAGGESRARPGELCRWGPVQQQPGRDSALLRETTLHVCV